MSAPWTNDDELFSLMRRELSSAVLSDVLDEIGLSRQFLPPEVRPLDVTMILAGRAMPVMVTDCFEAFSPSGLNPLMSKPFGLMLEALDDLKPGEVYLCAGASGTYALWNEWMTARAIRRGAAGAVVYGHARHSSDILRLRFPTFARGLFAQDQRLRAKVVDFRVSIELGWTRIRPGDVVFGDLEGVCVIPRAAEEEVVVRCVERARTQGALRKAIDSGMSAVEAFARHGGGLA